VVDEIRRPHLGRSVAAGGSKGFNVWLLVFPELIAQTIATCVRRIVRSRIPHARGVIEALGALEPVWDELYPAEQARTLRLLIERIDVAPDGLSVTLHAAGIRSLVAELANEGAAEGAMLEAAE
jgi:hypothetical protein